MSTMRRGMKMGWIKERILIEHKKCSDKSGMDWSLVAEEKILRKISEMIIEAPDVNYVGEYLVKTLNHGEQNNG